MTVVQWILYIHFVNICYIILQTNFKASAVINNNSKQSPTVVDVII